MSLKLLVDYESSGSDEESLNSNAPNQQRLPVPEYFLSEKCETDNLDNPDYHEGRIRSFGHQRGNWVSFIYVPYNVQLEFIEFQQRLINISEGVDLKSIKEPHISLSRTFILFHHWINDFIDSLRNEMNFVKKYSLVFEDIDIYVNDEQTRTFVALKVGLGKINLSASVEKIDNTLKQYKLKSFYENPSYHMSILWCLGNKQKYFQTILPLWLSEFNIFCANYQTLFSIYVDKYECKVGNKMFKITLI